MKDPRTGKEYIVVKTSTLKHDVNQEKCKEMGGYLPEPRDELENKFLDSLGSEMFLLGINDEKDEGQWVYNTDGSALYFFSWVNWTRYPDPPREGRDGNCATMLRNQGTTNAGHRSQDWSDRNCESDSWLESRPKSLVCERHSARKDFVFLIIVN